VASTTLADAHISLTALLIIKRRTTWKQLTGMFQTCQAPTFALGNADSIYDTSLDSVKHYNSNCQCHNTNTAEALKNDSCMAYSLLCQQRQAQYGAAIQRPAAPCPASCCCCCCLLLPVQPPELFRGYFYCVYCQALLIQ
jgi:hypothetical protein